MVKRVMKVIAGLIFVLGLITVIIYSAYRINNRAEAKDYSEEDEKQIVINALAENTEDQGNYIISIVKAYTNVEGIYYHAIMVDDDGDTTLYLVEIYNGEVEVYTVDTWGK